MRTRSWGFGWVLAIAAGCGSSQHQPAAVAAPPPAPATATAQPPTTCPMMPASQVSTADTADGVAIAFVTSGDPTALRAHVHRMAAMHGMHGGMQGMQQGGMRGMQQGGMQGMQQGGMQGMQQGGMSMQGMPMISVPSHATAEDIPGGARLVLTPDDPSQLPALRDQVRQHVAAMQRGECPMMRGPGMQQQQQQQPGSPVGV